MVAQYKDDLYQTLGVKLVQLAAFFTYFPEDEDDKIGREHFLYKLLVNKKFVDTFPNFELMLLMYLVLMVTSCSGEHSFSKLKFINNRLRTTMSHHRLGHLISIGYDILRETDFDKMMKRLCKSEVSYRVQSVNIVLYYILVIIDDD